MSTFSINLFAFIHSEVSLVLFWQALKLSPRFDRNKTSKNFSEFLFGIGGFRVGHIYSLLCILRKMLEDGFE